MQFATYFIFFILKYLLLPTHLTRLDFFAFAVDFKVKEYLTYSNHFVKGSVDLKKIMLWVMP